MQCYIEEGIEKALLAIHEIEATNILWILGYPGSGKTSMAVNLSRWAEADKILSYFISPNTPREEWITFQIWLKKQLAQKQIQEEEKCIVNIDGIEYLSPLDHKNFSDFLYSHPNILFILYKRLYEAPHAMAGNKLIIDWKENVDFEENFTEKYCQKLKKTLSQRLKGRRDF